MLHSENERTLRILWFTRLDCVDRVDIVDTLHCPCRPLCPQSPICPQTAVRKSASPEVITTARHSLRRTLACDNFRPIAFPWNFRTAIDVHRGVSRRRSEE